MFALRDWLVCGECGCKITAENQRGHVYYRCTHRQGRDACSQRTNAREEKLSEQLAAILGDIEIDQEIVEALVRDSLLLDQEANGPKGSDDSRLKREIAAVDARASRLLDGYLDGVIPAEEYHSRKEELANSIRTFERALRDLKRGQSDRTPQVRALAETARSARISFDREIRSAEHQVLAA